MGTRIRFHDGWDKTLRGRIPWDADRLLNAPGSERVKGDPSRIVVRREVGTPAGGGAVAYFKCYRPRNGWVAFRQFWLPGKAVREYKLGHRCFERGIPTARPLACAEVRQGLAFKTGHLILEEIPEARSVREMMLHSGGEVSVNRLARLLGEWVARIHARGFYHDDFRCDHILLQRPEDGTPSFSVIDLDGCKILGEMSPYRRVKNLAQLLRSLPKDKVPPAALLRFLAAYGRFSGVSRMELRRWAREAALISRLRKARIPKVLILVAWLRERLRPSVRSR